MTLHTLNKQTIDVVRLCSAALATGDSLLLYEDGVYAALDRAALKQLFANLPVDVRLYVLIEDLEARGIIDRIPEGFTRITYRDFVALSLACGKVVSWN